MVIQLWTICLIVTKQDCLATLKALWLAIFCAVTKSGKQSFFLKERIWLTCQHLYRLSSTFLDRGEEKKGLRLANLFGSCVTLAHYRIGPLFYISYKHLFVRYKNEGLIAVSSEICNERSPPKKSASKLEKNTSKYGFAACLPQSCMFYGSWPAKRRHYN